MTTQHTTTPWGVGCGARSHFVYRTLRPDDSENEVVARCSSEANAAFIVRACNAYDDLVAACHKACAVLAEHVQYDSETDETSREREALDLLVAELVNAGSAVGA